MKKYFLIALVFVISFQASAQYDSWFENKTLRLDYFQSGDSNSSSYTFDELIEETYWGGSHINLIDTFEYGKYFVKVFDSESETLIYSRGYSTLFGEWQTTDESAHTSRTMSETVVFPYPKKDVRVEIYARNKKGIFVKEWEHKINIQNYFIKKENRLEYPSFDVLISGDESTKVDIVILPEGYTSEEMGKFIADCEAFKNGLFKYAPYDQNKDKFNIRGILAPSAESGSDIPADGIWKETILNTCFYTFDLERYVMTSDNKSVRDLAANAPYDQIYILVNTKKYGGGAIYNHYSSSVTGSSVSDKIIIHELGHAFVGLGDEYYNSKVAYNEFYPLDVEPWEPNITTLVNFDKKWKNMLPKKTPIPTPAEEKFENKLGVFEGGGYAAKGIFRPKQDCLMNTFKTNEFCGVCKQAIQKMIDFYSK